MAKDFSTDVGWNVLLVRVGLYEDPAGGAKELEMGRLMAWLRAGQLRTGSWLRANKLKALVMFLGLNVLSGTARTSLDGVFAVFMGFFFMSLAILLAVTFLQGGRRS